MRKAAFLGFAALLIGVGLLIWRGAFSGADPDASDIAEVSPAAALAAETKIASLRSGEGEARLDSGELTSLLRFRPETWYLGPVLNPEVHIVLETLTVSGSVATADLPPDAELDSFRYLLPETTHVAVAGTVSTEQSGSTTLRVSSIEVAGMPVPERFYPLILDRMGRGENLPSNAIVLPLPDVVSDARVEGGELVLLP
jgi:hypothetical protein